MQIFLNNQSLKTIQEEEEANMDKDRRSDGDNAETNRTSKSLLQA